MDADEVRRLQQIRRADGARAEPQVRDGVGAGLLRVVDEVALGVAFGVRGQDLRRVLVRADRAVGAQAEEQRAHDVRRLDVEARVDGRLVCDTSSVIPIVNPRFGSGFFSSSKTVLAIAGSKSFEDKP